MTQMSFTKACKEYFGYKPGQNLAGFMDELKALTAEDKAYFTKLFPSAGIEIHAIA
jgi:hypothetical protein